MINNQLQAQNNELSSHQTNHIPIVLIKLYRMNFDISVQYIKIHSIKFDQDDLDMISLVTTQFIILLLQLIIYHFSMNSQILHFLFIIIQF